MRFLLAALLTTISLNAYATISGPSCQTLTQDQKNLITAAAYDYAVNILKVDFQPIFNTMSESDCHDYDGVHSSTEFLVGWLKTIDGEEKHCLQTLGVEAGYDAVKKEKIINNSTQLFVSEVDELVCEKM